MGRAMREVVAPIWKKNEKFLQSSLEAINGLQEMTALKL